jgi:hypothetical protein
VARKLVSLGAIIFCLWLRLKSVEGLNHSPPMGIGSADTIQPAKGEICIESTLFPNNLARQWYRYPSVVCTNRGGMGLHKAATH